MILVDADACPVKHIIEDVAKQYGLRVIMFIDTSHVLNSDYSDIVTVSQGMDVVDYAIVNRIQKDDIVITQDYGVAAMCLPKKTHVLNQNGLVYSNDNIDRLLFERHISQKVRRSGGRTMNHKKRLPDDDVKFRNSLVKICESLKLKND